LFELFDARNMISPAKLVGVKLKVGLLGFGSLGQHIYEAITSDATISSKMEVQYVWNRSSSPLDQFGIPDNLRLKKLEDAPLHGADIVIEVSHPNVSKQLAVPVMQSGGNFVVGSPTALADHDTELAMRKAAAQVMVCLIIEFVM
jgi:predicted dinucleotide-utilizing enzyme